jgi:hypothetical protein
VHPVADIDRDRVLAVMALIFTALLGIAGYVVQSKNATAADRAQHEIVQEAADRDQARGLAAIQLERVRSQMAEALVPLNTMLNQADQGNNYMARELGFEFADIWNMEFVRPFKLWPHIQVRNLDWSAQPAMVRTMKGSPYNKFGPRDIALLEDPTKRQIYIEAHTGCMVPCWREAASILATKGHLLERPPSALLDGIFPHGVADWTKSELAGSLINLQYQMGTFADAWAPLERRWEAGDFSRMQPAHPNPWMGLATVVVNMLVAAGARQKELEGASSQSGRKSAALDAFLSGGTGVAVGIDSNT